MKYIDAFRDQRRAQNILAAIRTEIAAMPGRRFRFMEFCGGHTHAIYRFGLPDLLPPEIEMIHGPGCPVCVLPIARLDQAVYLATQPHVILCTYGDMLRVPGSRGQSLLKAKAAGADIRMITAPFEAITLAKDNPHKRIVFFAIGFETTTPPTAALLLAAQREGLTNLSVFCNHVLTPPALKWLLNAGAAAQDGVPPLDGFVGPSHVSAIIGTKPYQIAARDYGKPVVIAGFEPLDVLQAILMLLRQCKSNRATVENEYTRAVTDDGNIKARAMIEATMSLRDTFEWRGLGFIPHSALGLKDAFASFDAEKLYDIPAPNARENPACQCPAILRGAKKPHDCKLFGTVCNPENPMGSCMVSSEGACAAWYSYGRHRMASKESRA